MNAINSHMQQIRMCNLALMIVSLKVPQLHPQGLRVKDVCRHQEEYLDICRCLRAVFETPSIADDATKRTATLKQICW